MSTTHAVTGTYVDGGGAPVAGTVAFAPILRGTTDDGKVVLPYPVTADLDAAGTFTVALVASTGQPWHWQIRDPDGTLLWFDLDGDLDVAALQPCYPPAVQVTGPAGSTGPQGPTGAAGPEGPQGPIGPQGSAVLPDTGWLDARQWITLPFVAETGERAEASIRRIGSTVQLRLNARYEAGHGTHRYGEHTPVFTIPEGFREVGWHGAVGSGSSTSRFLTVDIFHAENTLNVIDVTSTQSTWAASQHVAISCTWTTDDPLPPGTGATGELPWATAAPSAVGSTGSAGTSKQIPHADHTHAGLTVTRTPATGRWLLTSPDGGTQEVGDTGVRNLAELYLGSATLSATATAIQAQRVGDTVELSWFAPSLNGTAVGKTDVLVDVMTIPAGFRPSYRMRLGVVLNGTNTFAAVLYYADDKLKIRNPAAVAWQSGETWFRLTYQCVEPWPDTLPGVELSPPR